MELREKCRLLGSRIHEIRERQNKTQDDVALKAKLTPSYFSRIETGKANPSFKRLNSIAEALGVEVHEFFGTPKEPEEFDLEEFVAIYWKLTPEQRVLLGKLALVILNH